MEVKTLTNLNTASLDDLIAVPGIGEVLAERVIEARPFSTVDDVLRVNGIGPISLHKIAPYATVGNGTFPIATGDEKMEFNEDTRSPEAEVLTEEEGEERHDTPADLIPLPPLPPVEPWTEDETVPADTDINEAEPSDMANPLKDDEIAAGTSEAVDEEWPEASNMLLPPPLPTETSVKEEENTAPEAVTEKAEKAPPEAPEKTEAPAPPPEKAASKTVTRGQITWLGFIIFVLTLIAAVALSLGILAGINGGLQYATPAEVATVAREVNALEGRADALEQSLAGVQSRLDNLEALSGRVDKLETTAGDMQGELDTLASETEKLNTQVQDLNEATDTLGQQIEEVQVQTSRFQALMDGLRDLLNNLFPTE